MDNNTVWLINSVIKDFFEEKFHKREILRKPNIKALRTYDSIRLIYDNTICLKNPLVSCHNFANDGYCSECGFKHVS